MPFNRPLLRDLIARISEDIAARLPGAAALMRRSVSGALARALAGGIDGVYGYLTWLSAQIFPDTAESVYLNRWAAVWGVTRRLASVAQGKIRVSGLAGSLVPAGTLWSKSGSAQPPILLSSVQDITIPAGGVALVPARALDAGAAGNLAAGVRVALLASLAGVMADARIDAAWGGGADLESDESLRERLLSRIQQPPEGGSAHDYLRWALEVPGVTRAWVYPHRLGLGTVGVMVMWQDGAQGDRQPTDDELKIVFEHIDILRPVTAGLFVFAPIAQAIDLAILLKPMTEAVKAATLANLSDLFWREGAPGGVLLISHIREAISTATGEWDHVVEVAAGPGLSFDRYGNVSMTHAFGIPKLGKVTWLPLTLADDPDARCGATDEDYRSMLADLLPTGPVWPRDPESNLQRLLLAMAADFARAHNRGCDLIGESVPTDASELLPDWERLIGPDPCAPAEPATLGDRRRRIVARLNYRGGQSIAIFRDLALASFGIELCFAEFRPFRAGPNGPTPGLVTGHRCQAEFYGHAGARLANNGWRFAWSICLCSGPSAPLAWLLCLIDRARPAQSLLLWDTMRPDGLEVFKHAPD